MSIIHAIRALPTSIADERGATALEYGFMISLIAGVVAVALGPFGGAIANLLLDGLAAFP